MSLACGDYKTDSQECCARKAFALVRRRGGRAQEPPSTPTLWRPKYKPLPLVSAKIPKSFARRLCLYYLNPVVEVTWSSHNCSLIYF